MTSFTVCEGEERVFDPDLQICVAMLVRLFWNQAGASVGVDRPPSREGEPCCLAASSQRPQRRVLSPLAMPSEGSPSEQRPTACLKKVKEKRNRNRNGWKHETAVSDTRAPKKDKLTWDKGQKEGE